MRYCLNCLHAESIHDHFFNHDTREMYFGCYGCDMKEHAFPEEEMSTDSDI